VPPTIIAPAIPSFFITFLLKNSALFGGVSVGGEEGVGPSDVEWLMAPTPPVLEPTPPDIGPGEGIDPSNAEKWCKGVSPCGGE
jgi:hypothetical protein